MTLQSATRVFMQHFSILLISPRNAFSAAILASIDDETTGLLWFGSQIEKTADILD